jgi:tRNA(Ile)-lysidine synthetase-like protein
LFNFSTDSLTDSITGCYNTDMEVELPKPGKYIIAVSGGVDSVVLLDMLQARLQSGQELIVAHFDHGIRTDSKSDRLFVEQLAKSYGLPFVFERAELGADASEAQAREARYAFLRKVMNEHEAVAIITAHHQDDLIETAILNMLRGTGRKGLTSLQAQTDIIRPLLATSKNELQTYAATHKLEWREDSTNLDTDYLRNYVRLRIVPALSNKDYENLLRIIKGLQITNKELDTLLVKQLSKSVLGMNMNRREFVMLPHSVAKELMASWLRAQGLRDFDRPMLERLVIAAKVSRVGKHFPIYGGTDLVVSKDVLALRHPERHK